MRGGEISYPENFISANNIAQTTLIDGNNSTFQSAVTSAIQSKGLLEVPKLKAYQLANADALDSSVNIALSSPDGNNVGVTIYDSLFVERINNAGNILTVNTDGITISDNATVKLPITTTIGDILSFGFNPETGNVSINPGAYSFEFPGYYTNNECQMELTPYGMVGGNTKLQFNGSEVSLISTSTDFITLSEDSGIAIVSDYVVIKATDEMSMGAKLELNNDYNATLSAYNYVNINGYSGVNINVTDTPNDININACAAVNIKANYQGAYEEGNENAIISLTAPKVSISDTFEVPVYTEAEDGSYTKTDKTVALRVVERDGSYTIVID